jgi:16S rRNA (guanine527-N7)-methyltransferase
VLEEARARGFLGPGPVEPQVEHAAGFAVAAGREAPPGPALDLGSGGGLPGLVLACSWPGSRWTLVEANRRRAGFLAEAVDRLGCENRVAVVCERAEVVGRDPKHRGHYGLVVARGFGAPAVTAECGAPLLHGGGTFVISEPPRRDAHRWPASGLELLGLVAEPVVRTPNGTFQPLRQASPCPDRYPRRVGMPRKRPLF